MKICEPDYLFDKTVNITPEFVKSIGVSNLLLDVDNTLATHGNPIPADGIVEWIENMQNNGIKLMIVSNNYEERVAPFAKLLGLPFSSFSTKPLSRGFKKCFLELGCDKNNTAVVGDQILTDVIGAHILKMPVLMVLPIEEEERADFKFKRQFEKKYIDKYIEEHGGTM